MSKLVQIKNLNFSYGNNEILKNINMDIYKGDITAIFGDSGSGKTSLLYALSLMYKETENAKVTGTIMYDNKNILEQKNNIAAHRRKITYIYQQPNPLNMSIYKNVAFPLKIAGIKDKEYIENKVTNALKDVHLYQQIGNRLNHNANELSGGQKQKLCIARALVMNPDLILFDEPTSSLDKKSKNIIEDLILELKQKQSIVFVSHDEHQIERLADKTHQLKS